MNLEPDYDGPVSLDRLAGDWKIYQLQRGHRFSADDMFTAWMATRVAPNALSLCDLGAGIGSVGLMAMWKMQPEATLLAVEAQAVSHRLMRRTVAFNGLGARVALRLGDLRDVGVVPEHDVFDLVTGSPPYIPLGKGVVSPVAQRAACRMELRGTIADYAATAARIMQPNGWFVACFAAADPRGVAGIAAAGLHLRVRQDIVFRGNQAPLISLFAATRVAGDFDHRAPFPIRGKDGEWTAVYHDLREEMGTKLGRLAGPSRDPAAQSPRPVSRHSTH